MVKVLYTTDFADVFGGGQASLLLLLERLDRRRFSPVLVAPAEGEMARRARALGAGARAFAFPPLRSGLAALRALRAFRALLKDERPRLIHTDGPRATLYAALAKAGLGMRLLWHIRTERRDGLLDRFLERACDRLILVAAALGPRFSRGTGRKTTVVYNGVDLSPAPPADERSLPSVRRPLVVCPARLDDEAKGQRVLLESLRGLGASVWFAGRGGEACVRRLREQAKAWGLSDAAIFLGQRDDLRSVLALADVVALPSLHEAFPRALLEAMAEGRAVVATRVGGVAELVVEGETGLLVPPGDAVALRGALKTLLDDPSRRQRMGRAGRERAEKFSIEATTRLIEGIYDEEAR